MAIPKDLMYHKFRAYGFLKNLRFFDPFIILFFREMGLSFLEIGVLFSVREISTNFLEIPTGVLADSYGRRKSMLAAFASYLIAFAIFYAFPHFMLYIVAMILFAFGEAFRSGTHKAMILEYLRIKGIADKKVEYYGHTRAASQFGSAIAALIAAGLVFHSGSYRIVFLASMVPYVLELFLMASYPKVLDGELIHVEGGWVKKLGQRIGYTTKESIRMLRRIDLLRGLLNGASFDALFKSTKDYLQPILQSQAVALPVLISLSTDKRTALIVGGLYFFIYLGTSYAASHAGTVVGRVRSLPRTANFIYLAGAVLLAGAGLSAWKDLRWIAIVAFLVLYVLQNLRRPVMVGYLAELIPQRTMATGLSVESQLRTLIMAGLAPIVGMLADRFGVGLAVGVIGLIGLVLTWLLHINETHVRTPV